MRKKKVLVITIIVIILAIFLANNIISSELKEKKIVSIDCYNETQDVFNIKVQDYMDYFALEVLVHNTKVNEISPNTELADIDDFRLILSKPEIKVAVSGGELEIIVDPGTSAERIVYEINEFDPNSVDYNSETGILSYIKFNEDGSALKVEIDTRDEALKQKETKIEGIQINIERNERNRQNVRTIQEYQELDTEKKFNEAKEKLKAEKNKEPTRKEVIDYLIDNGIIGSRTEYQINAILDQYARKRAEGYQYAADALNARKYQDAMSQFYQDNIRLFRLKAIEFFRTHLARYGRELNAEEIDEWSTWAWLGFQLRIYQFDFSKGFEVSSYLGGLLRTGMMEVSGFQRTMKDNIARFIVGGFIANFKDNNGFSPTDEQIIVGLSIFHQRQIAFAEANGRRPNFDERRDMMPSIEEIEDYRKSIKNINREKYSRWLDLYNRRGRETAQSFDSSKVDEDASLYDITPGNYILPQNEAQRLEMERAEKEREELAFFPSLLTDNQRRVFQITLLPYKELIELMRQKLKQELGNSEERLNDNQKMALGIISPYYDEEIIKLVKQKLTQELGREPSEQELDAILNPDVNKFTIEYRLLTIGGYLMAPAGEKFTKENFRQQIDAVQGKRYSRQYIFAEQKLEEIFQKNGITKEPSPKEIIDYAIELGLIPRDFYETMKTGVMKEMSKSKLNPTDEEYVSALEKVLQKEIFDVYLSPGRTGKKNLCPLEQAILQKLINVFQRGLLDEEIMTREVRRAYAMDELVRMLYQKDSRFKKIVDEIIVPSPVGASGRPTRPDGLSAEHVELLKYLFGIKTVDGRVVTDQDEIYLGVIKGQASIPSVVYNTARTRFYAKLKTVLDAAKKERRFSYGFDELFKVEVLEDLLKKIESSARCQPVKISFCGPAQKVSSEPPLSFRPQLTPRTQNMEFVPPRQPSTSNWRKVDDDLAATILKEIDRLKNLDPRYLPSGVTVERMKTDFIKFVEELKKRDFPISSFVWPGSIGLRERTSLMYELYKMLPVDTDSPIWLLMSREPAFGWFLTQYAPYHELVRSNFWPFIENPEKFRDSEIEGAPKTPEGQASAKAKEEQLIRQAEILRDLESPKPR